MILNLQEYRKKVLGCWMGKNIGGTLGAPFEWKRQINNISFYTQELDGNPLPNDDLDLQLLWLIAMEENGIDIDAKLLGEYWLIYVTPHWVEYGTAKINMKAGLLPPLSGMENNDYKHSCGAFIRSEIWACIAPGHPETAVKYAFQDAIVDHGNGEGTYAEVFCAALESAAFVEKDVYTLIDVGLSYIPEDCAIYKAVKCAINSYIKGKTWKQARDEILTHYRGSCFLGIHSYASQEDVGKGFADGEMGWDAPSNIGMLIIGLLYGEGDFDKSICIAVNCGEDTDCTAATLGSIFGIIHGIDAIQDKWKKPIGRKIKTACLNLGELGIYDSKVPGDIDVLSERVEKICLQVINKYNLPVSIKDNVETNLSDLRKDELYCSNKNKLAFIAGPLFLFDFFDIQIDYIDKPTIKNGEKKKIIVRIENKYRVQAAVNIHWYLRDSNWRVYPANKGKIFFPQDGFAASKKVLEFYLETENVPDDINRFVIEFTLDGRPTVMLVPVVLLNGNIE